MGCNLPPTAVAEKRGKNTVAGLRVKMCKSDHHTLFKLNSCVT